MCDLLIVFSIKMHLSRQRSKTSAVDNKSSRPMITIAFNTAVHFMVTSAVQLKQSRLTVAFDHLPCHEKDIAAPIPAAHTMADF